MITWNEGGVVHNVTHINKEKRAARLACTRYVEFWPRDVSEDETLSCLTCVSEPPCVYEGWPGPLSGVTNMARVLAPSKFIQQDVDDRWQDVVDRCGPRHRLKVDSNDRCTACGYG